MSIPLSDSVSEDDMVLIPIHAFNWAVMVAWHDVPCSVYIERQLRQRGYGELVDRLINAEQSSRRIDGGTR